MKWFVCSIVFVCLDCGTGISAAFVDYPLRSAGRDDTGIEFAHKQKSKKSSLPPEPVHVDCRCPPGYSHVQHSCVKKDYAGSPKAVCSEGQLDKGQCVVKESEVLDCPAGSENECDMLAPAKKRCCRQTERVPARVVCPEDTEETRDGTCKRLSRFSPRYHCPPGYIHQDAGFCIRIEEGSVVPVCGHGGELAEDNFCSATAPGDVVHECPEGYECASNNGVLSKTFCTSCVKEKIQPMRCSCPAGTKSVKGLCYTPADAARCFPKSVKKKPAFGKASDQEGEEGISPEEDADEDDGMKDEDTDVEADLKKFGKKCGAISPACVCEKGTTMRCSKKRCQCITEEIVPVQRRCLGQADSEGNCVKEVRIPPVYQCGEGQECEVTGEKNECRCVKKFTAEHSVHCEEGVLVGAECFAIEYLEKASFCPPEFELVCKGDDCHCQRESFVARVKACPAGSYVTSKGCKRSYTPEFVCTKGILEKGKCYHKNYAVQVCDA